MREIQFRVWSNLLNEHILTKPQQGQRILYNVLSYYSQDFNLSG